MTLRSQHTIPPAVASGPAPSAAATAPAPHASPPVLPAGEPPGFGGRTLSHGFFAATASGFDPAGIDDVRPNDRSRSSEAASGG